jgi:hypothetical protein
LTHAATGLRPARGTSAVQPEPPVDGFERAVGDSRRKLERAIRAYHATVSSALEDGDGDRPREPQLEILARALSALASAVDHAATELDANDPLAARLRASGLELRELALDVLAHSQREELPTVFDDLEQNLISAASTILSSGRQQPQPA